MPRYFFHTAATDLVVDPIGREFPSLAEAKAWAVGVMAEMLAKSSDDSRFGCRVLIADADGETMASLRFSVHRLNDDDISAGPLSLPADLPRPRGGTLPSARGSGTLPRKLS